MWVRGIESGQIYAYRVDGPYRPGDGDRFNSHKLLLDPYATAITGIDNWDFTPARGYDSSSNLADLSFSALDDAGSMPKCVFTHEHFDWQNDSPPKTYRF